MRWNLFFAGVALGGSACGGAPAAHETTTSTPAATTSATTNAAAIDPWDACTGETDARPAFEANVPAIQACYQARLADVPTLTGELMLAMRAGADGLVDLVALRGSIDDAEMLACVRQIAGAIRFPPPHGGTCVVVAVPLDFTPRPAATPQDP